MDTVTGRNQGPILGIDFLRHHRLLVNTAENQLISTTCSSSPSHPSPVVYPVIAVPGSPAASSLALPAPPSLVQASPAGFSSGLLRLFTVASLGGGRCKRARWVGGCRLECRRAFELLLSPAAVLSGHHLLLSPAAVVSGLHLPHLQGC